MAENSNKGNNYPLLSGSADNTDGAARAFVPGFVGDQFVMNNNLSMDLDIPESSRETLGAFLSDVTKKNLYYPPEEDAAYGQLDLHTDVSQKGGTYMGDMFYTSPAGTDGDAADAEPALADAPEAISLFKRTSFGDHGSRQPTITRTKADFEPLMGNYVIDNETQEVSGTYTYVNPAKIRPSAEAGYIAQAPGSPYVEEESKVAERGELNAQISKVLKYNRFSPLIDPPAPSGDEATEGTPFMRDHKFAGATTDDPLHGVFYTRQESFGRYDPAADSVVEADLVKVGLELMLRGTGEGDSGVDAVLEGGEGAYHRLNLGRLGEFPQGIDSDALFFNLGNLTQGGVAKLMPRDIIVGDLDTVRGIIAKDRTELHEEHDSGGGEGGHIGSYRRSYGSLNSFAERFDGAFPVGMAVQAIISIAVLIAIQALALLIGSFFNPPPSSQPGALRLDPFNPSLLKKGRHRGLEPANSNYGAAAWSELGANFLEILGIPKTNHNFFDCMFYGTLAMFNLPTNFEDFINPSEAIGALGDLLINPGFFVVIIRSIARDLEQIETAFSSFGSTSSPGLGSISSFFQAIDSFTSSSVWKYLMITAKVGSLVLDSELGHPRLGSHDLDALPAVGSTRAGKSRIGFGSLAHKYGPLNDPRRLVWSQLALTDEARSAYLMPAGFVIASARANHHGKAAELIAKMRTQIPKGAKLSKDVVATVENTLETEYVPFYFHDLRTNEIITFHAFIESVGDTYSPNYQSSQGYGRTDAVRVYGNTERSLTVTFHMVATSPEDHDVLWYNANKLVSMVYPQYSAGRVRNIDDKNTVIQPFSQIPTASPMIRLRIGDLVKSNYSRFGLARMFGLGDKRLKLDGEDFKEAYEHDYKQIVGEGEEAGKNKWSKGVIDKITRAITPLDFAEQANDQAPGELGASQTGFKNGDKVELRAGTLIRLTQKDGEDLVQPKTHSSDEAKAAFKRIVDPKLLRNNVAVKVHKRHGLVVEDGALSGKLQYVIEFDEAAINVLGLSKTDFSTSGLAFTGTSSAFTSVPAGSVEAGDDFYQQKMTSEEGAFISPLLKSSPGTTAKPSVITDFFKPEKNAVVRGFENTAGRGLAGFITSLDFDYGDSTWDIRIGSKAPIFFKVTFGFAPTHDLPIGLDHEGMLRSTPYPVGRLSDAVQQGTHHTGMESAYNRNFGAQSGGNPGAVPGAGEAMVWSNKGASDPYNAAVNEQVRIQKALTALKDSKTGLY